MLGAKKVQLREGEERGDTKLERKLLSEITFVRQLFSVIKSKTVEVLHVETINNKSTKFKLFIRENSTSFVFILFTPNFVFFKCPRGFA